MIVASGTRALGAPAGGGPLTETPRHTKATKTQKDAAAPGARRRNQKARRDGAGGEGGRADADATLGRRQAPVTRCGKPEKRKGWVPFALLPGCYWVPRSALQPSLPWPAAAGLPPSLPVSRRTAVRGRRRGVQVRFCLVLVSILGSAGCVLPLPVSSGSAARAARLISSLACSSGMAGGSLCAWWCCALACALALVAADAVLLVDITYVQSAVAKGAGERSAAAPLHWFIRSLSVHAGTPCRSVRLVFCGNPRV